MHVEVGGDGGGCNKTADATLGPAARGRAVPRSWQRSSSLSALDLCRRILEAAFPAGAYAMGVDDVPALSALPVPSLKGAVSLSIIFAKGSLNSGPLGHSSCKLCSSVRKNLHPDFLRLLRKKQQHSSRPFSKTFPKLFNKPNHPKETSCTQPSRCLPDVFGGQRTWESWRQELNTAI